MFDQRDPELLQPLASPVLLEAEGDVEEAAISYRRAATADPGTTKGRLNEINAVLLDGDPRQAEALLRQAIALDPASDRLHKLLGDVLAVDANGSGDCEPGLGADRNAKLCRASSDNGMHAWLALGRCRDRRVRAALPVDWAAKCSGGLVAASSRSEALGRQPAS